MGKKKKKDLYDGYDYAYDESGSNTKGILDIITAEYVTPDSMVNTKAFEESVPTLVANHLCMTYASSHDYSTYGEYPLICYHMIKHDKSLERFKRLPNEWELGQNGNTYSNTPKIVIKYVEYALESPGFYAVQLDDMNFMVLDVKDSTNNYMDIDYSVHFVGEKCMKYYRKMKKKIDEYMEETRKESKTDLIFRMLPGGSIGGSSDSLFKTMDDLILPNKEEILHYVDNWKKNIPLYYDKYNIIPKLSIMIYGEPGTGKSTFAKALSKYLDICSVTLVNRDMFMENPGSDSRGRGNSGRVSHLKSIITLDDIDCICKSRKTDTSAENAQVLSNLLEFLDNPPTFYFTADNGVKYPVSIVVATTNFIDMLDPAVKRHGRFDMTFEMHELDYKYACEMASKYDLRLEDITEVKNKEKFKISPSYLQALCVDNIDKALKSSLE